MRMSLPLLFAIIFLEIVLLICSSCSWKTATVTTGYGQQTKVRTVKHVKPRDYYTIKTVTIMLDNFELNINDHRYETAENKFNTVSAGFKYHLSKTFGFCFVDVGAGFRLTEVDERNKWLAESHLLADISLSAGIKKEFEQFDIKLFYTFQHLSVPWRHDQGLNYDVISFELSIPF